MCRTKMILRTARTRISLKTPAPRTRRRTALRARPKDRISSEFPLPYTGSEWVTPAPCMFSADFPRIFLKNGIDKPADFGIINPALVKRQAVESGIV